MPHKRKHKNKHKNKHAQLQKVEAPPSSQLQILKSFSEKFSAGSKSLSNYLSSTLLLSFFSSVSAKDLYLVLDKINYAIQYEEGDAYTRLPDHLMKTCQNLAILSNSALNYNPFYHNDCLDLGLTMSIESGQNNTDPLMSCAKPVVDQLCSDYKGEITALSVFGGIIGLMFLMAGGLCCASIIKNSCYKKNEGQETKENKPDIEQGAAASNDENIHLKTADNAASISMKR